jgi:nucleoside-diphosphate-sugar epimerase
MLVPNIFNMVKNRKEISLASGIGLKFTPIYIDDAVRCLQKLLLKNDLSDFEILNLCGDEIIGLIDLVQKLETYLCVETKKVNTNLEYTSLIGDNSKLRRFIDDPFVCFEEGLKLTFFKMMGR